MVLLYGGCCDDGRDDLSRRLFLAHSPRVLEVLGRAMVDRQGSHPLRTEEGDREGDLRERAEGEVLQMAEVVHGESRVPRVVVEDHGVCLDVLARSQNLVVQGFHDDHVCHHDDLDLRKVPYTPTDLPMDCLGQLLRPLLLHGCE